MISSLDSDLRERFSDPEQGDALLEMAREELERRRAVAEESSDPVDIAHVGRWAQRLSEYCRFAGRLRESLRLKDEVLELWSRLGKRRAGFLTRLQRAVVLAELGESAAGEEFGALRDELQGDPDLQPFYGAFLDEYDARRAFWEGRPDDAAALLERALVFRRENRAARIVERTEIALRIVRDSV